MTFQYFFFDTNAGYALQLLPLSVVVGLVFGIRRYRSGGGIAGSVWMGLFAAYLTGLVGLTLLLEVVGRAWYWLIYRLPSGRQIEFFSGVYDLVPDFWRNIRTETIANAVLFVPFGILHPLAAKKAALKKTLTAGAAWIIAIELAQPVFGRAFDINDVILNLTGVAVSAAVFYRMYVGLH